MKPVILCLLILCLAAPVSAQMVINPQSSNPLNSLLQQYKTRDNSSQQSQEQGGFHFSFGNPLYNGMRNQYNDTPNSPSQPFYGTNVPDWSQGFYGGRAPVGGR
ncbi:MAG: hypothetical protein WA974_19205 [Thermodesulfobacteriota bacterium]